MCSPNESEFEPGRMGPDSKLRRMMYQHRRPCEMIMKDGLQACCCVLRRSLSPGHGVWRPVLCGEVPNPQRRDQLEAAAIPRTCLVAEVTSDFDPALNLMQLDDNYTVDRIGSARLMAY